MTDIAIPAARPDTKHETEAPPGAIEIPDFQIVPRRGLVLVAIVLVALIVAIAVNKLWPLTFFHVAFGAAWTIIDLFLGLVLGPIMGKMSVPARIEFTTRLMPKMLLIMPVVVTATLAASALLLVINVILLSRVPDFDWDRFFQVARWSMLAYLVIAGVILYAFLQDHVRGGTLVVLTLSIAVFAVHVPLLVGFTVARYSGDEGRVAA